MCQLIILEINNVIQNKNSMIENYYHYLTISYFIFHQQPVYLQIEDVPSFE